MNWNKNEEVVGVPIAQVDFRNQHSTPPSIRASVLQPAICSICSVWCFLGVKKSKYSSFPQVVSARRFWKKNYTWELKWFPQNPEVFSPWMSSNTADGNLYANTLCDFTVPFHWGVPKWSKMWMRAWNSACFCEAFGALVDSGMRWVTGVTILPTHTMHY